MLPNYPVYIHDTQIGSGCTSIYSSNTNTVGIGVSFLDNVYNVTHWDATAGIITCNVHSSSPVIGLTTSGTISRGKVSWGRLYNITRTSSAIAIGVTGLTIDSELSSFPTIQRRDEGLRSLGALREHLGA